MAEVLDSEVKAPVNAVGSPNAKYVLSDGNVKPVSVNRHYSDGTSDLSLGLSDNDLPGYFSQLSPVAVSGSVTVSLSGVPYGTSVGNWYLEDAV